MLDVHATADDHLATLRVLAGTKSAIVLVEDAHVRLGLLPSEAAELIGEFARTGWVQFWPEWKWGPAVVLSTVAAAALGLEMVAAGRDLCRWIPIGKVRRARMKAHPVLHGDDVDDLVEHAADPHAVNPCRDLPSDEAAEGVLPRPRLILGLRPAWPVEWPDGVPCPACGGRKLPSIAACVVCDRTGVDHRLASVKVEPRKAAPKSKLSA